jgi:hypothetical protein
MKALRIFTLIVVGLFAVLAVSAQESYKILFLNSPCIRIGEKECKVGDCFDGNAPIHWDHDEQAMKVVCMDTQRQSIVVAKHFKSKGDKSLTDYLVQSRRLSTRGGAPLTPVELKRYLSDKFYLIDSICVSTTLPTDGEHFFYVAYDYKGQTINKRVRCNGKTFILDRSLFFIDEKPIVPFEATLSVFYLDEQKGECLPLANDMYIVPIKLNY